MMSNKKRSTLYIGVTNNLLVPLLSIAAEKFPASREIITAGVLCIARIFVIFVMQSHGKNSSKAGDVRRRSA